jgi:AcrR family transcriptional regulator
MTQNDGALATRELIVQAAGVVFSERHYTLTTLDDVTSEAALQPGDVAEHFVSKKAVALEVIARQHELFIETGGALLAEEIRGVPAMILLSRELVRHITTSAIVRAGLRLSTESADVFVATASGPYEDWIRTSEVFIRRAVHEGDITPAHDPERLAAFVIATFTGVQSLSQARTGWTDILDRLEEMWGFLLQGIASVDGPSDTLDIRALLRG